MLSTWSATVERLKANVEEGSVFSPCSSCPADPGLGAEEPQELPAGQCHLPQPAGGVRGAACAVLCHQECQEKPQLRRLRALHGSGEDLFVGLAGRAGLDNR